MKRPTKINALSRIGIIQFCIGGNHCAGVTGKKKIKFLTENLKFSQHI